MTWCLNIEIHICGYFILVDIIHVKCYINIRYNSLMYTHSFMISDLLHGVAIGFIPGSLMCGFPPVLLHLDLNRTYI
jgi:hypothetical protein